MSPRPCLSFEPPFSDRKIPGVTRVQRTVLGNGMNHNHSQALARRTTHPVLQYTGFIHEKVRVVRTMQLVDESLIHVHDHCSLGFLFRKRTAQFYEKPANSGLPLLVEGGDFDPSSAARFDRSTLHSCLIDSPTVRRKTCFPFSCLALMKARSLAHCSVLSTPRPSAAAAAPRPSPDDVRNASRSSQ